MSEFHVQVVKIDNIEPHFNADSLSISMIHDGYPVIFRTGDFHLGELAVYIPIDAIVPDGDPRFAFLGTHRRIKAKKLRGVFSMGLLIKSLPEWVEGQNVQVELGITKWEPAEEFNKHRPGYKLLSGEDESPPSFLQEYTDIEGLRKYGKIFEEDEEVVLTEKIHGSNARYLYKEGRLWVGSRHRIKKENDEIAWWKAARQYNLSEKLSHFPDIALYGEMYGKVQDLTYGIEGFALIFFDAKETHTQRYLNYDEFIQLMQKLDLPTVPILYKGPWHKELRSLANGPSAIQGANHMREGFVAKPIKERWDQRIGRVILKLVGEDYLLR